MKATPARARRWATAALSALALTAVAACGGGKRQQRGSGSADQADLTWQFWIGGTEDQAAWQKVADQAHTDHSGITVKLQGTDWNSYWSKIGTLLASGKAPCIIGMQSLRTASYASAMLPLDDLMKKYNLKAEDFDKPIMDGLKVDGKQIAIPYDSGPMVIFYNKDMFKAAGVADPKPGWTMDDFNAAAKKLTAAGRTGLVTAPGDLGVTSWVRTFTGAEPLADGKLALTDPKFEQGFQSYTRLRPHGQDRPAGAVAATPTSRPRSSRSGKAAMQLNGPWSLIDTKGKVKFQLGIAPIPAGPDGSKTYTAGSGFGISRSCKTPDAAFQAIMSMTSEKPLTTLASAGRAYPARTAAHPAWFTAAGIDGAKETLDYASENSVPAGHLEELGPGGRPARPVRHPGAERRDPAGPGAEDHPGPGGRWVLMSTHEPPSHRRPALGAPWPRYYPRGRGGGPRCGRDAPARRDLPGPEPGRPGPVHAVPDRDGAGDQPVRLAGVRRAHVPRHRQLHPPAARPGVPAGRAEHGAVRGAVRAAEPGRLARAWRLWVGPKIKGRQVFRVLFFIPVDDADGGQRDGLAADVPARRPDRLRAAERGSASARRTSSARRPGRCRRSSRCRSGRASATTSWSSPPAIDQVPQ